MGSKKQPYDAEFREGAVRIVIETGKPVPEVAEELGINPGTLHSWVSRWRRNGTASSDRPAQTAASGRVREAERVELERLRREMSEKNKRIRELEMERDVLKRCMVLWVK
ncbi:transposase [Streptomyces sp. MNU76]|uniref:transposase n=1 Tax=Streptomyces sp. MNU76 TaxID=2560026 RepID=UPI001E64BDCE|nr:transposase [Streptomyces sp. MNU76]MCC9707385.1 transposase [Streptomyces sp. MNU76]MCC9707706.1 transposase [Streptomyces sp. MNU76]